MRLIRADELQPGMVLALPFGRTAHVRSVEWSPRSRFVKVAVLNRQSPADLGTLTRTRYERDEEVMIESPRCGMCGEQVAEGDGAEMYDPRGGEGVATYCHAECGLARGYEVA